MNMQKDTDHCRWLFSISVILFQNAPPPDSLLKNFNKLANVFIITNKETASLKLLSP